jgi:YesN/AraC family two-component response regulator
VEKQKNCQIDNIQILIVDDSGFSRNMMQKTLNALGIQSSQIQQASDGEDALRKMEAQPFELFILDIVMTGMDGIAVLKVVKNKQPDGKVIMCSGSSSPELIKELITIGIDAFIVKPYKEEDFIRAVCSNLPQVMQGQNKIEPLNVRCHVCDRKMIEVNAITTVSFFCPNNCMQIGPTVYALSSQEQIDEDYNKARQARRS